MQTGRCIIYYIIRPLQPSRTGRQAVCVCHPDGQDGRDLVCLTALCLGTCLRHGGFFNFASEQNSQTYAS